MKLKDIETFVVGNPPPHFGGRYFVFVKLTTDSHICGVGEAYCVPFHPDLVAKMLEDVFGRYLEGQDPHGIETLWRRVYSSRLHATSRPHADGRAERARDGLLGHHRQGRQSAGLQLLGGRVHERLRSYTYIYARAGRRGSRKTSTRIPICPPSARRSMCSRASRRSNSIRPGPTAPSTAGSCHSRRSICASASCAGCAKRSADKADLLFGTHGQMTAAGAIRLARRLEPYDPLWFEEPVPPDAPEEMAQGGARHHAFRSPPASGSRPSTISRGCLQRRRRGHSADESRAGRAAFSRRRKSPAWPRCITCRSRRICTAVRCRRRQHPARHLQPEFPDSGRHRALAGLPRRHPEETRSTGRTDSLCRRPSRAWASSSTRTSRASTPIRERGCTLRWWAIRSASGRWKPSTT